MAAISIVMFCNNAGTSAAQPKKPVANVNLQLVPRQEGVPDENADTFVDPSMRAASLNLSNVTPQVLEAFRNAPRVRVTIEPITE
jgi:hypothetical protein